MDDMFSAQLPIIGREAQERLSKARVAVIGCGGLGSFTASLLARAGVGFLRLVDSDEVEESNLHRVMEFNRNDVGKGKAETLKEKIMEINRDIKVEAVREKLTPKNVKILKGIDLVMDCTDNMEARFLINSLCFSKTPWVHMSCMMDVGFVMPLNVRGKPCFNCLYSGKLRTCSGSCLEEGIVSPAVSVTASLGVWEAIKILGKFRKPNYGKLCRIGLSESVAELLDVKPKKGCEVCGNG